MAKGNSFPANLVNVEQLRNVNLSNVPDGLPFIVDRIWYILNKEYVRQGNRIDEIPNGGATFVPMPFRNISTPTVHTLINANTPTTRIDLNTTSSFIYINLETNTNLEIVNFRRYNEYTIAVAFNNFKITNLFNIARWNISSDYLINSFNPILIFRLTRADVISANIVSYGDYFSYKDKEVLLQIVPRHDWAYFNNNHINPDYFYAGSNNRAVISLTSPITIPFQSKFDLSANTTFQFYADYEISTYSSTFVPILSFWGGEQVFRIEVNQNTIRYVYRTLTYTHTFPAFTNGRRYKLELVRVSTNLPATAYSLRLRDTTTNTFIAPLSTTAPTQAQITSAGEDHVPFSLESGICGVSRLHSLVWTKDNNFNTIANRNFITYDYAILEAPESFNRRNYLRQSSIIFYAKLENSATVDDTASSIPASIVGSANFTNEFLALSAGSSISYVKNNDFNLNDTDFSISFYCSFTNSENTGTILSIWSATSKQFIVGITANFLVIRIRTVLEIINLDVKISTLKMSNNVRYIEIVRSGFQYIVFIDGMPVKTKLYSDATMNFGNADFVIGKPLMFDNDLPFTANTFNGLIKDVKIARTSPNVTSYFAVKPRDANPVALALWKFYVSEFELVNNLQYSQRHIPFLTVVNNRNVLSNESHFVINSPQFNLGGSGLTIETYITIPSANITAVNGTILEIPTVLQFGVSNRRLRIIVPSGSVDLTGTTDIPTEQRVHLAYVRDGNNHTLYLGGIAVGTVIGMWSITTITQNLYVKRVSTDNNNAAVANSTNFSGKLFAQMDSLAILPFAKYTSNFTPDIEI